MSAEKERFAERDAEVWRLRMEERLSPAAIRTRLNMSEAGVYKALDRERARRDISAKSKS